MKTYPYRDPKEAIEVIFDEKGGVVQAIHQSSLGIDINCTAEFLQLRQKRMCDMSQAERVISNDLDTWFHAAKFNSEAKEIA